MSDYFYKRLLVSFLTVGLLAAPLQSEALDLLPSFNFFRSNGDLKGQDVWQFQDQFVRIVPQDKVDGKLPPPNDQPARLNPVKLREVLGAIQTWGKKGVFTHDQDTTPVFTPTELDILSRALAEGLAKAKPTQDVVFWIIGMHQGTFAKEQQGIAGRVFYRDGKLNLIFGDMDRPVGLAATKDVSGYEITPDRRTHPIKMGMRAEAVSHNWRIATRQGMDFHPESHGARDDWLVMDLNQVIAGLQPSGPGAKAMPAAIARQRQQMRLEAQRLAIQRRQMLEEMARMRKEMREMNKGGTAAGGNASGSGVEPARSPEERLATLDELLKKKLITQEEYKAKRKEILNQL